MIIVLKPENQYKILVNCAKCHNYENYLRILKGLSEQDYYFFVLCPPPHPVICLFLQFSQDWIGSKVSFLKGSLNHCILTCHLRWESPSSLMQLFQRTPLPNPSHLKKHLSLKLYENSGMKGEREYPKTLARCASNWKTCNKERKVNG